MSRVDSLIMTVTICLLVMFISGSVECAEQKSPISISPYSVIFIALGVTVLAVALYLILDKPMNKIYNAFFKAALKFTKSKQGKE